MSLTRQFEIALAREESHERLKAFRELGGAPICELTLLPSFRDRGALNTWKERNSPASQITRVWQCECGNFHYEAKPRAPSGASSGTERG